MAKMFLKPGANPQQVAERLRKQGFVMKQQLPDGSYILYKRSPSDKVPLDEVVARFGRVLQYPFGRNHLAVLMHGWAKKHPEQAPSFAALSMRKRKDGFPWLNKRELTDLGRYAGYDITQKDENLK